MTAPDKNSLQSLSISSALNNILAFFNSQDNNSSWKSLTTSSEGSFLIRLLAIVTSNISYKVVSYVREAFLSTCNLLSSAIGISVNLGYSVYRGSNQQRLITILPNKDLVIPKYTVIGTYNSDYDIITTENYKLTNNEPIDINTVIGKMKNISQTVGTSDLKVFSFYTNNISEDLILLKDSIEVPYSKNPRDMADDVYWIRTNPNNSIDIQYLNNTVYTSKKFSVTGNIVINSNIISNIPSTLNLVAGMTISGYGIPYNTIITSVDSSNQIHISNNAFATSTAASLTCVFAITRKNVKYPYSSGTVLTVKYIELADVPTIPYTNDMFTDFSLVNTRIIRQYVPPETVDNIKTTAPYYHETQNLIRSKKDYPKRLPEIDTAIVISDYNVVVPTYAAVSYIKNDYSLLTNTQLNNIYTTLSNERFLASPLPDITHPVRELITLDISFKFTTKFINYSDVNVDIQNLLSANYYKILNNKFSTYDLEELFTKSLSYVKFARVNVVINERTNSTKYNIGDVIELNGIYYKATNVSGTSSSVEPNWSIPLVDIPTDSIKEIDTSLIVEEDYTVSIDETNAITVDNDIVWKTYKRLNLDNTQISQWEAGKSYKIGDYVYSTSYPYYMFKVVDLIKYNDPVLSAPPESFSTVGEVGTFIEDGNILWVSKLLNTSYPMRSGNTSYKLGDCIQQGSFSYECIGYIGESSDNLNNFELDIYNISLQGEDFFDVPGDYTKFFKKDDVLKVYVSNSLFFSFSVNDVNYVNSTSSTRIKVNQVVSSQYNYSKIIKRNVGTSDGSVFWEILEDITAYTSSWKKYNTIKYNLKTL